MHVGYFVSCGKGVSRVDRFLSQEIYNFRRVCKRFAALGASVIASHARNHEHSAYKSILCDFTSHSLEVLSAVAKNDELSTSITSVYFILWRFNPSTIESYKRVASEFHQDSDEDELDDEDIQERAESRLVITELLDRWQQRNDFFKGYRSLEQLNKILEQYPSLDNYKWIENDCDERFFGRRPQRYAATAMREAECPRPDNSFSALMAQSSILSRQTRVLTSIFEQLTHLHLLTTVGSTDWHHGDIDLDFFEGLVNGAYNMVCLRVEGPENTNLWSAIFRTASWPKLKKLILRGVQGGPIQAYISSHAASLQDIRISDVTLNAEKTCELLASMRRCVSHAQVEFFWGCDHLSLENTPGIQPDIKSFLSLKKFKDGRRDYGQCVMKKTLRSTPLDEPDKSTADGKPDEAATQRDSATQQRDEDEDGIPVLEDSDMFDQDDAEM